MKGGDGRVPQFQGSGKDSCAGDRFETKMKMLVGEGIGRREADPFGGHEMKLFDFGIRILALAAGVASAVAAWGV